MVVVAQLVRASDCGSEGRGFESRLPPVKREVLKITVFRTSLFISSSVVNRRESKFMTNFATVYNI